VITEEEEEEATLVEVEEDIIDEGHEMDAPEKECLNSSNSSMYNEVHETMLAHDESPVIYEDAEKREEVEEAREELPVDESVEVDHSHFESRDDYESRDVDESYINQTSEEYEERAINTVDCKPADDSSGKEYAPELSYNETNKQNVGSAFGGITLSEYIQSKTEKDYSDDMSVISFGVSKLNTTESNLYNRILAIQGRRKCDVIYE